MTFSAEGTLSSSLVIAGSGDALYNFLFNAMRSGKNDIETLICHDKDRRCMITWFFTKPKLLCLPDLALQIQPAHLTALTTLQLLVTLKSKSMLDMLVNLLKRQCLVQLKALNLQYSSLCCADIKDKNIYFFKQNYPSVLGDLYQILSIPLLPQLEHLRLLLWCEDINNSGLQALKQLYPRLKKLTIDSIAPTAQIITQKDQSTASSSYPVSNSYGGTSIHSSTTTYTKIWYELKFPIKTEYSNSTLINFLRDEAKNNQLECLEIYNWPVAGKEPSVELQTLLTSITQGWLPKLNSIVLRPNADEFFVQKPSTSRDTWLDTKDLLNTVIEKNLPIVNLQLLLPEQNFYISWLEHIAAGRFPALKTLHYRLPDPSIEPGTLHKESEETHYPRVINSLTLIFNAIVERRVPKLESVIFEGELPEPFTHLVNNIENELRNLRELRTMQSLAACYI